MKKKVLHILGSIYAIYVGIVFLVLLMIFYPLALLATKLDEKNKLRLFFFFIRWQMECFIMFCFCRVVIKGRKYVKKNRPYIVVLNHRSFFDAIITTPFFPRKNYTIAKMELFKIPLFNTYYKLSSVPVDRKSKQSKLDAFHRMKEVLNNKYCMCIFSEGTRNKTEDTFLSFKDGAFSLAMEMGVPIIPTVIVHSEKVMPATKLFYFLPYKTEMHILPEINPKNFSTKEELKKYCRDEMKKVYLKKRYRINNA